MSKDISNGGRVTTREFYEALLDQNKQRSEMETRLGVKIDSIHTSIAVNAEKCDALEKRIDKNEGRIGDHDTDFKDVRKAQKVWGIIDGGGTIGAILLALLGR